MSLRLLYSIGFLLIILLLSISLYLQFFQGFMPCPLCSMQRICFAGFGLFSLIGILFYKNDFANAIVNTCLFVFSSFGLFFAGRQIWLQHFVENTNVECGADLAYIVKVFSPTDIMKKILQGSAECTQRGFEFLYLDMAEWSFVWFVIFFLLSLYILKKILAKR